MTTTISAWFFRSSMKRCGNSGRVSVLQLHDRRTATAFVLRRKLETGDERMIFEKRGDGAPKLSGAMAVNDADRMLICDRRFIQKFFEPRNRVVNGLPDDVQF